MFTVYAVSTFGWVLIGVMTPARAGVDPRDPSA
jgi:hypothetical protein